MDKIKIERIAFFTLHSVKYWYLLWILVAALSISIVMFLSLVSSISQANRILLVSFVLLIKSIIYFYISGALISFIKYAQNRKTCIKRLSLSFLILFILDFFALFNGTFQQDNKSMLQGFLKVLPEDGWVAAIYSKVYIYIPAIFNFVNPRIEGTSLLIISVLLGVLYTESNQAVLD